MIIIALSLIHIFFLNLLKFTAWPEMISYPYLFLNGFSLYKDFVLPYPPGLIFYLSFFYLGLGLNPLTLKIATWVLIFLTDICLFTILKKITTSKGLSIFLICSYFIFQSFLEGNMLWFDYATVFPTILSFLFLTKWVNSRSKFDLFFAGVSLSLSLLLKQIAVIYLGLIIVYLIAIKPRKNELSFFFLGLISLLVPFGIYLTFNSSLQPFLNWAFIYPLTEWSRFPGYVQFKLDRGSIYLLGALSLPLLSIFSASKKIFKDHLFWLCGIFFLGSILATYPRFSFFHLQAAIAFLVILIAFLIKYSSAKKFVGLGLLTISTVLILNLLLPNSFGGDIRFYEQSDKDISDLIKRFATPNQIILLINIHSNQYSFTKTFPPKPWLDNFGWYFEIPGVQDSALASWQKNLPEFVFRRQALEGNWFDLGTYEPRTILKFITNNYQKIADRDNIEVWRRR